MFDTSHQPVDTNPKEVFFKQGCHITFTLHFYNLTVMSEGGRDGGGVKPVTTNYQVGDVPEPTQIISFALSGRKTENSS